MKKISAKALIILISSITVAIAVTAIVLVAILLPNKYKVSFYKDESTLIYTMEVKQGEKPSYDYEKYGTPSKNSDTEYDYVFAGWKDGSNQYKKGDSLPEVTKDTSYYAYFDANKKTTYYTIKFYDEDGTTLLKSISVEKGKTPVYDGDTPSKARTQEYTYTFSGWNPELKAATEDASYKAVYTSTKNIYTLRFVDTDDTVISSKEVEYGTKAIFEGDNPTKNDYQFVGWTCGDTDYEIDDELPVVTDNVTYKARYIMVVDVNYDSASITIKESTIPEALVEFDLVITPDDTGALHFNFGNLALPIYVNGELVEDYVPVPGEYKGYVSKDLKVYLIEPKKEDAYIVGTFNNWEIAENYKLNLNEEIYNIDLTLLKNSKFAIQVGENKYGFDKLDNTESLFNNDENNISVLFGANYTISFNLEDETINVVLKDEFTAKIGTEEAQKLILQKEESDYEAIYSITLSASENSNITFNTNIDLEEDKETYLNNIAKNDSNYLIRKAITNKTLYLKVVYENNNFKYIVWLDGCPKDFTITYNLNGGSLPEGKINPVVYTVETEDFKLNNPGKDGYTFVGWTSDDVTNPVIELTVEKGTTGILSFTANYSPIEYTITYNLDGGLLPEGKTNPTKYTIESEDFMLNKPEKDGYIFIGWTSDKVTDPVIELTVEKGSFGDLAFTANYHINEFTVTFDVEGIETQEVKYGEKIVKPENPIKTGYEFVGWLNGEELFDFDTPVTTDLALKAKWDLIEYTITYNLNGGELEESKTNPSKYTIETESFTLNNPSKTGYDFNGWTSDVITIPQLEVTITTGSTGNLSFVANYTLIEYTITYNLNGGELEVGKTNPDKYTIESETFTLNNPVKDYYNFIGWTSDVITTPTLEITISTGSTGDLSFVANYTPIEYTITYNLNGGELEGSKTNPVKYTVETESFTLNNPSKTGYEFNGWTSEDITTSQLEITIPTGSHDNLSFVANYVLVEYTITYNLNGGELEVGKTNPDKYTIESETFTLNNPAKDYYNFVGWTSDSITTPTLEIIISTGSTGDLSFVANYTPIEYTITYNLNGGELEENKTNPTKYTVETESFTLNNPIKTGYLFAGWEGTGLDSATVEVTITLGSHDNRSYNATWTPITYTVKFYKNADDATGKIDDQTFTYDVAQNLTFVGTNYNYSNMEFKGWATSPDGTKVYDDGQELFNETSTNNDIIKLYALWPKYIKDYDIAVFDGEELKTTYLYTGAPITPTIKVGKNIGSEQQELLALTTDYTVEITNNVNVGSATVTVTGKGAYGGINTSNFTINPKTIFIKWIIDDWEEDQENKLTKGYVGLTIPLVAKAYENDTFKDNEYLFDLDLNIINVLDTYNQAELKNVGDYIVTASTPNNYTTNSNLVKNAKILPAELIFDWGTSEYDGTAKELNMSNLTITGVKGTDIVTLKLDNEDKPITQYVAQTNAGNYVFDVELNGTDNDNYVGKGLFNISPRIIHITWESSGWDLDSETGNLTKTYDATDVTITASYFNGSSYVPLSVARGSEITDPVSESPIKNAGTYTFNVKKSTVEINDPNVALDENTGGAELVQTYVITPKMLTISWTGIGCTFDESSDTVTQIYQDMSLKVSVADVIGTEPGTNVKLGSTNSLILNKPAEGLYSVGTYRLTANIAYEDQSDSNNYVVKEYILKIVRKKLSVIWNQTGETWTASNLSVADEDVINPNDGLIYFEDYGIEIDENSYKFTNAEGDAITPESGKTVYVHVELTGDYSENYIIEPYIWDIP